VTRIHVGNQSLTDREAMEPMSSPALDARQSGGGVEAASRTSLTRALKAAKPVRPVIEDFGGPRGRLEHVRQVIRSA